MQTKKETTALVWFNTNLRVQDNSVLASACREHDRVIGIYCFDPRLFVEDNFGFKKTEKFRAKFLIESVQALKENLEAVGFEQQVESPHHSESNVPHE